MSRIICWLLNHVWDYHYVNGDYLGERVLFGENKYTKLCLRCKKEIEFKNNFKNMRGYW